MREYSNQFLHHDAKLDALELGLLPKKHPLVFRGCNNHVVTNIPFLDKVFKAMVATQLQTVLDDTDYLDTFWSCFKLCCGTQAALATLIVDLCQEIERIVGLH